ncbi:MAG: hypothetical protein SGARI_001149 [Bacillariaceae sp.]
MADLGLFGLMQDILEMYKVIPRKKKGTAPPKKAAKPRASKAEKVEEPRETTEIVELDPDKNYNFRTEFTNGYIDPFSGTAPGATGGDGKKDNDEGSGGDDSHFLIYFDMKTGCLGKIPRSDCASKGLIVTQDDDGLEVMEGEIEDDDEKEKLIWDMKKAMKNKKGGGASRSKSPGPNKKYITT